MKRIVAAVALVLVSCSGSEKARQGPMAVATPSAKPATAPSALTTDTVYDIGGDVLPPKRVSSCDPVIPEEIKGRRITQPTFTYKIVVSAEGKITSLTLDRASHTGDPYDILEGAFRKAIADCRFEPATRNGVPVAVRMMMVTRTEVR